MDKFLWDAFKQTGDLRYYLLLKQMENESNADQENKRNSNK